MFIRLITTILIKKTTFYNKMKKASTNFKPQLIEGFVGPRFSGKTEGLLKRLNPLDSQGFTKIVEGTSSDGAASSINN